MNDVMIRNCDSGEYLASVVLSSLLVENPLTFVSRSSCGLVFENEEIAQATIDFISNVIDFEIAECLEIVIVP